MIIAIAADVSKRGMVGVDAGVNHADNNALTHRAGQATRGGTIPDALGANPGRTGIGVELELFVRLDKADVGQAGHDKRFLQGQLDG